MTTEHSVRLVAGPRLRFVRPSADLMFESVARAYADRAIGVVLSGAGSDAAAGSLAMIEQGGKVLAQGPASCPYPEMPSAALRSGGVEQIRLEDIGAALQAWLSDSPRHLPASPTTVFLVDDHQVMLDELNALLRSTSGIRVIGNAADGRSAVLMATELAPDVVVIDIGMPDLNGIDATRRIRAVRRHTGVVGLSASVDRTLVRENSRRARQLT